MQPPTQKQEEPISHDFINKQNEGLCFLIATLSSKFQKISKTDHGPYLTIYMKK